ncbi:HAD family phosphatase [Colidextribacter sp. OB.20]|uniref:HAD-IA family hydrolase n=1 Tax=Colidextribacter sp. OB.20 TaxID=2304568 RepID=UPI001368DCB0|nr:HAD family phosphatase [Colidextribacter sp. OB.20]
MIQNIVFDMGGVLIDYVPARFVDLLGLEGEDKALLLREVFNTVEWVQMDRGAKTEEEAAAVMKRNLPARLHGAVDRLVFWWELEMRPMEGMEALVKELKGLGYPVYLLSNASLRQPEYFDRIPGSQYFDGKIVSAFYKLLKPQPEIFRLLTQKFGLKLEECFFVDDLAANVEGAVNEGLSGAVFHGVEDLRKKLRAAGVPVNT